MAEGEIIRTVLGDIEPAALGRTNVHEHLLMRSPLLRGDELDDVERSAAEAIELHTAGFDALIELTPIGLGRDPINLAKIAERSHLHIVLATGIHQQAHYPPEHWIYRITTQVLADLFIRDILVGCDGSDYSGPREQPTTIRAGVIKVGTGYWQISPTEQRVLNAAGFAHRATGVPIACHLEQGTAGWQVLQVLQDAGVALHRVMLSHVDRNPDPGLHAELAAAGVYLGYDGMARAKYWPDSTILDCLLQVAARGGAERILLGGDVARRSSMRAYGGMPGMAYLPQRFIPRLRQRGGDELVQQILVTNPARYLAFTPQAGGT